MTFIHHLFDFFKALLRLLAFSSPWPVGQLEPVALSFLPERPREVECKLGLEKLGPPTARRGGISLAVGFTRGVGHGYLIPSPGLALQQQQRIRSCSVFRPCR